MTAEELDRWATERVMGWHEGYASSIPDWPKQWLNKDNNPTGFTVYLNSMKAEKVWQPSNPATGQIWMVVEKMRELLGWNFNLNWQGHPGITIAIAQFHKFDTGTLEHRQGYDDNPCIAILKAAHGALEGEK